LNINKLFQIFIEESTENQLNMQELMGLIINQNKQILSQLQKMMSVLNN
jgi:hypothetical protein